MLYAALGGYARNTGVPVTPFTALQAAAVYACIRFISQDIAMLKPFVRRALPRGGYTRENDLRAGEAVSASRIAGRRGLNSSAIG